MAKAPKRITHSHTSTGATTHRIGHTKGKTSTKSMPKRSGRKGGMGGVG